MTAGQAALPDGGHLFFADEGDGEPVVLVSGLGGRAGFFAGQAAQLRAAGYRTLCYDHRGVGGSSALATDTTTVADMAADLEALLDARGLGAAVVLGHSTGGAIAQALATRAPGRLTRLVLSATFARPCPYMRLLFESRLEILAALGAAAYRRHATLILNAPYWIAANAALLERELAAAGAAAPPDEARTVAARIGAILAHDAEAALPGLAVPALILVAADDVVTPPYLSHRLADLVPGARLETLPRGGHYALRAEADAYAAAVLDFLGAGRRP